MAIALNGGDVTNHDSVVSVDFGAGRTERLVASRSPHWRVDRAGALTLFADAGARGDASYTACIIFRN